MQPSFRYCFGSIVNIDTYRICKIKQQQICSVLVAAANENINTLIFYT